MNGFLYGIALQWRLDIRSRALLVTCYLVPLAFFLLMGGLFTSVMPEMKNTLIQSMIVMSVSMGAFIGLPPSLVETYGSDVKKVYKANGVPLYLGLVTMAISAFFHLLLTSAMILLLAPVLFGAALPASFFQFFLARLFHGNDFRLFQIGEHWRCAGAGGKKPGKIDNGGTACVSALYYAFRHHVPHKYAAGLSGRYGACFARFLGIQGNAGWRPWA